VSLSEVEGEGCDPDHVSKNKPRGAKILTFFYHHPTAPENSSNYAPNTEHFTPARAKVKAVIKFNDAHKFPYYKEDVF
jgi:hypothetical protein